MGPNCQWMQRKPTNPFHYFPLAVSLSDSFEEALSAQTNPNKSDKMMFKITVLLSVLAAVANAHSFLLCSDYTGDVNQITSAAVAMGPNCQWMQRKPNSTGYQFSTSTAATSSACNPNAPKTSDVTFESLYNAQPLTALKMYHPGDKITSIWPHNGHTGGSVSTYLYCSPSEADAPFSVAANSNTLLATTSFDTCNTNQFCYITSTIKANLTSAARCTVIWDWLIGTTHWTSCSDILIKPAASAVSSNAGQSAGAAAAAGAVTASGSSGSTAGAGVSTTASKTTTGVLATAVSAGVVGAAVVFFVKRKRASTASGNPASAAPATNNAQV
eukprot:TRINITY_DN28721_c0_g1_i1.p1 TRINITY_DN28721_c0_g1~~TRINITY_DN28721_c0_g1_i1.p1  ORF type:complete len:339 (-),score=77.03 TRINITY_DN28721_c0_g1_i1:122-1108(-)